VEKYLFVGRLLRDHELHKQEREQRLKRMIGLQTYATAIVAAPLTTHHAPLTVGVSRLQPRERIHAVEGIGGHLPQAPLFFRVPSRFVARHTRHDTTHVVNTTRDVSLSLCSPDFARLVRKYQIERPAGEILCGPFDNAEMPKVRACVRRVRVRRVTEELLVGGGLVARQTEATYTVLVTLAMALDDTTLSENIQTNFKRGEYFKTDDDLSDPTGTPFSPVFSAVLCR
jgi:hypothetical protein